MTDSNPFIDYAKTQELVGLAEGKAEGERLVSLVRQGELDAHGVEAEIRRAALNAFAPYKLLGFSAALVEALQMK